MPLDFKVGSYRIPPPPGYELWPAVKDWKYLEWAHWLAIRYKWSKSQIDQYMQVDRYRYGLGFRRDKREPMTWFYLPLPKQIPFHACKTPNVLFGGAAGVSKSHAARHDAYRNCFAIPEFQAIIMRRTFQELKKNHMRRAAVECKRINDFFGKVVVDYVATEFEIRFTQNDAVIVFGHCQNPGDEEKYLGDEYDAFYPDEIATFLKEQVLGVASRLRSTKPGVAARMGGTSNPGGTHTRWCVDYFIDHKVDPEEDPAYDPTEWEFIPGRLYDNPYLMDPDGTWSKYEKRLIARGPTRAKQLLLGDWGAVTGQYFEEWSEEHTVNGLPIPPGTIVERWIDWGYGKNGICVWAAILPSGRIYIFHEYVFKKTLASVVAKTIRDETINLFRKLPPEVRLGKSVGDPAMFAIDGQTGESYADVFKRPEFGIALQEGDNQRVLGWGRFREWLALAPDGHPWLVFDDTCEYCIRSIPSLVESTKDPEDLNTEGEDHGADAIRYGLMARPSPDPKLILAVPVLPDSAKALLDTLTARPAERQLGMVG